RSLPRGGERLERGIQPDHGTLRSYDARGEHRDVAGARAELEYAHPSLEPCRAEEALRQRIDHPRLRLQPPLLLDLPSPEHVPLGDPIYLVGHPPPPCPWDENKTGTPAQFDLHPDLVIRATPLSDVSELLVAALELGAQQLEEAAHAGVSIDRRPPT